MTRKEISIKHRFASRLLSFTASVSSVSCIFNYSNTILTVALHIIDLDPSCDNFACFGVAPTLTVQEGGGQLQSQKQLDLSGI